MKQKNHTQRNVGVEPDMTPMQLDIKVHQDCKLRSLVDAMDASMIADSTETRVTQIERF